MPGIPTEEDVRANGIKLRELNAKLLGKIEELTLHLIAQNNTIETMSKEVEELKAKLSEIEKMNAPGANRNKE